jgi:hypothetical protein
LTDSAEREATELSNEEGKGEGKKICVVYTFVESGEQKTEREENSLKKFSYSLLSEGETSAGITRGGTLIDITITDNLLCHKMQV